jgi:cyclohexanecarboxylate-CoA ligase
VGSLRATLAHRRAARYRRPGGPWDRAPLDAAFASPAGGRPVVVDDGASFDGPGLEAAVSAVAGALLAAGVRRRRVVAWQMPNSAAALVLYRSCWRLGVVAAPLHHRLGTSEVRGALDQVDPALVLAVPGMAAAELPGAVVVERPSVDALLASLPAGRAVGRASVPVSSSQLAVALFTSGSTGVPKAVLHTHRALGYKAATMVGVHGLGTGDAVLMPAPLAHVSGLLNGVLIPALAGIPVVLMGSWDPEVALERIEAHRVSFMGAPPVFFSQMAASERFTAERVGSLRLVSTGGASVSPAFVESTASAFGCRVKRTYGSTEAPTITTSGPADPAGRARDSDGRPVGEAEIEVHDPATGQRLPPGTVGELWLRGPELFVGYADADQTRAVIGSPGGWYRSGDLGVVDDEGWLQVVGRISDVIIRAGENISASEVEAVLEAHPAVRHAVAVPVPDPAMGERVAAFVEADVELSLEECRAWFADRGVARFKTPEYVVRLKAMPVLAAGKPDRAALRARAEALVGSPARGGGAGWANVLLGRDEDPGAVGDGRPSRRT